MLLVGRRRRRLRERRKAEHLTYFVRGLADLIVLEGDAARLQSREVSVACLGQSLGAIEDAAKLLAAPDELAHDALRCCCSSRASTLSSAMSTPNGLTTMKSIWRFVTRSRTRRRDR